MAYLNANIPVEYAQIRRDIYMILKHQGEVEDCIIFGLAVCRSRYFIPCDYGERGCLLSSPDICLHTERF